MPQSIHPQKLQGIAALQREWRRRYGEPPAITADAALLERLLRELPATGRSS